MNWLSKRFTFCIIPDANSNVRKYQISGLTMLLLPVIFLMACIIAVLFILLFSSSAVKIDSLNNQLSASTQHYEQQLADKELLLTSVQSDLIDLLEQASLTETKIAEISELEAQLRELVGMDTKAAVSISSLLTEEGGQGGEEYPLTDEPIALASTTSRQYSEISEQLDTMIPQLEETKAAIVQYQAIIQVTPTIWPTDSRKVTSLYGNRKDPFTRKSTFHSGLDIGGNSGDPVYSAADGTVTASGRDRVYGNYITINHGRGIQTKYLHLRQRGVEAGDKVVKGQIIGQLGSTGRSTGPHLHYEVLVGGQTVNPEPYIKGDREEP